MEPGFDKERNQWGGLPAGVGFWKKHAIATLSQTHRQKWIGSSLFVCLLEIIDVEKLQSIKGRCEDMKFFHVFFVALNLAIR